MKAQVRFAVWEDLPALRGLFKRVFLESEGGLDLFFSRAFAPGYAAVASCGGALCGMAYILPAYLRTGGGRVPAAYLYALAVAPEFRSRGIAGDILRFLDGALPRMGFEAAVLRPSEQSLFPYYRRFGYECAFYAETRTFAADPASHAHASRTPLADLPKSRESYFPGFDPLFCWDAPMLGYVDEYIRLCGGQVYRMETQEASGYAVCLPGGDVRELGGENPRLLAGALCGALGRESVRVVLPAAQAGGDAREYALYKWLGVSRGAGQGYFALGLD